MSLPDPLEYANRYDYGRALCEHFGTRWSVHWPKVPSWYTPRRRRPNPGEPTVADLLRPGTLFRRVSVVPGPSNSHIRADQERIRMVQSVVKTQYCGCFNGGLWWEPAAACAYRAAHGPDDVFDGWTVTEVAPDCTDIVKAKPSGWHNEFVAVGGRILQLYGDDELVVVGDAGLMMQLALFDVRGEYQL